MTYDFLTDIAARQAVALKQYDVRQVGDVDGEPITLEEARAHCRVDLLGSPPESDDDFWLENIGIPAARAYCENYKGTAYAPRTMELVTNAFPSASINLAFGPVQSITSIKYDDQAAYDAAYTAAYDAEFLISADVALATAAGILAGDAALEQTVATSVYQLNIYTTPASIILQSGEVWPTARDFTNSVRVQYVAGFSLPSDSPQAYILPRIAKGAMLIMLEYLFDNRGDTAVDIPKAVTELLDLTPGGERMGFA